MGLIALALIVILAGGWFLLNKNHASQPPGTTLAHTCVKQEGAPACGKLLVFSKTAGFRHASIGAAIAAIKKLATEHGVEADFTEDANMFTFTKLKQYNAVVFLLTSGEVFDSQQQQALMQYVHAGGGYAGVHSASDTEHSWPWYGKLVGAFFLSHPAVSQATIDVVDAAHPSTSMLPVHWSRTDEWYNFATNPRASVHVLLQVDEHTYKGGTMGADHPIAWYHSFEGGRAWYSALGHTSESYSEPLFLAHLWGGISYAAGWA
ncbi:ThuA domain-containing protein [Ktedonosporobacter rubrisoli]|uniref:ThuA domain-containing protein n=2 Tax=Ktedonosporobacter rubrisoli TaxID=2509675 RepID=A0A4P6K7Z7_KTERU|nr:ThuA domain-containing protein [Ktedonosporobacter rubrisoli]